MMTEAKKLAARNGWVRNAETGAVIRPATRNERVLCEIAASEHGGHGVFQDWQTGREVFVAA